MYSLPHNPFGSLNKLAIETTMYTESTSEIQKHHENSWIKSYSVEKYTHKKVNAVDQELWDRWVQKSIYGYKHCNQHTLITSKKTWIVQKSCRFQKGWESSQKTRFHFKNPLQNWNGVPIQATPIAVSELLLDNDDQMVAFQYLSFRQKKKAKIFQVSFVKLLSKKGTPRASSGRLWFQTQGHCTILDKKMGPKAWTGLTVTKVSFSWLVLVLHRPQTWLWQWSQFRRQPCFPWRRWVRTPSYPRPVACWIDLPPQCALQLFETTVRRLYLRLWLPTCTTLARSVNGRHVVRKVCQENAKAIAERRENDKSEKGLVSQIVLYSASGKPDWCKRNHWPADGKIVTISSQMLVLKTISRSV